jgi:tRNA nucleotidyltransferase (CCA-adding enzyme)
MITSYEVAMIEPVARLKKLFPERLHSRLVMVGGMVRDILLGVQCQDVDLAAAISPSDLSALGFRLVQSTSTPNIFFFYDDNLGKVEVTRLASMDQLAEDQRRRDFTANAIAMTLDGEVIDPLGGQQDLQQRILRLCTPSSFGDDPARIFRAFRFESEGWRLTIEAEDVLLAKDWKEDFQQVPVERFSQEMLKALGKNDPCRFFQRMLHFRVGEQYLPEIFRMPSVPAGPLEHHPEGDLFTHAMQALERMAAQSPEPKARFCALFHDLGKLATPEDLYPRHHGHEDAGARAAEEFCKRLRLPLTLQRALQATCRLHGNGNRWIELRESTKIRVALGAIKGGIASILPLVVASDSGGGMPGWEETLIVASMNARDLGIDPSLFQNPEFPPEKCQQLIMQRRVEELRRRLQHINTPADRGIS